MTAFFDGKAIHKVDVQGNGESIYYALQEATENPESESKPQSIVMGMNRILCSNMKINFKDGKVNNISFYIMPDASFIPPHELKESDQILRGFVWRQKEKPNKEDVVKTEKGT